MLVESLSYNSDNQFYPTPPSIANKMLEGLDYMYIQNVLEPSAGKGNLVDALARAYQGKMRYNRPNLDVDCCEIDPHLRQILKYEYSQEKIDELENEFDTYKRMSYSHMTLEQQNEHDRLDRERDMLVTTHVHIVHDNFLTYFTYKHYDLILMNPPFADGDKHLLKAIEMQERGGGSIICLLNAETLRNPYTAIRKVLAEKLKELNADIQYIENAFSNDAERKADVDVAIVRIHIEKEQEESTIWEQMEKAVKEEDIPDAEIHALVAGDYIEQAIQLYKTEVAATMKLVKEYKALCPYMQKTLNATESWEKSPILNLTVGRDGCFRGFDLNKYLQTVRLKYWHALFFNKKFMGKLTSELCKQFQDNVNRMADYEFSAFNIKQIMIEMNASMMDGVKKAIMDLFDKLTQEHTWYPECTKNIHYFNGWKTNKAHKIGKKCIIPTYGMFSSYSWDQGNFDQTTAYKVISDIEKAFDYLNANRENEYDLNARLTWAHDSGQTRNIELKYFAVDFYKKGTTHIKFYPESMKLVERLNIYAAQNRNWLPPSYGQKTYSNMTTEEKSVVDSFHGDGTDGSGEKAYVDILSQAQYYLSDPTQTIPALTA